MTYDTSHLTALLAHKGFDAAHWRLNDGPQEKRRCWRKKKHEWSTTLGIVFGDYGGLAAAYYGMQGNRFVRLDDQLTLMFLEECTRCYHKRPLSWNDETPSPSVFAIDCSALSVMLRRLFDGWPTHD